MIIKNYIKLCELLGVKPTKGKGREYHIKELGRYCTFRKEGNKFIIDEVYSTPKPKIDNRKNNGRAAIGTIHQKYDTLMDDLLLDCFSNLGKKIDISFNHLFVYNICLFSDDYEEYNKIGYKAFAEKYGMTKGLPMTYVDHAKSIVKTCLTTSLNRLQRNNIITWEERFMILTDMGEQKLANQKITDKINKAQEKIYEKENIKPFMRKNPDINNEFKRQVCKKIDGIFNYWKVYSIEIIADIFPKKEIDKVKLINKFIDSIHEAVTKYKIKPKKEEIFGEEFYPYISNRNQEDMCRLDKLIWALPKEKEVVEYYEELDRNIPF